MDGYMPTPGKLKGMALDHRYFAKREKNPKRAVVHLEIAAVLETEAFDMEQEERRQRIYGAAARQVAISRYVAADARHLLAAQDR